MIAATSARILHFFPYFFITIFPTAFSFRSRMTGKYLISFCKKLFSYLLILIFYSYGSAHTYPFRRLRRHLSLKAKRLTHFYSVAPLLEKWFACFPTSGDGFSVRVISIFFVFLHIKTMNSFFLSVSFPRTRREVPSLRGDRGKLVYTG